MTRLRVWLLLAVWAVTAPAWPALAAGHAPEHIRIQGKEYAQLADWARANGLEWRWIERDKSLQLNNPSNRLSLTVDSREAHINGMQVSLLFPLANREGAVFLSQLDIDTTLQPILNPPRNRAGATIKTICLDPGHGGKDPGNRVGGREEKAYTLLLAFELRDQLKRLGFKVNLTRSTDTFVDLPDRPDTARRRGADLFVSLHFNATDNGRNQVHGSEIYCLTPAGASSTNARGEGGGAGWFAGNRFNAQNMLLAFQIQKSLTATLSAEDRGVKRARFAVLRDAAMPAVLIEGGFMTHPVEGRKIFDPAYRRQMAQAIASGLVAYKKIVEQGTGNQ